MEGVIPPTLSMNAVPENERDSAHVIRDLLSDLPHIVGTFEHALALFDFCEQAILASRAEVVPHTDNMTIAQSMARHDSLQTHMRNSRTPMGWQRMAGREGARAIFDLFMAITALRDRCNEAPSIKRFLEWRRLERLIAQYAEKYPDRKHVRHAAQHPVDLWSSPGHRERNYATDLDNELIRAPGARVRFDAICGRTVTYTYERRLVSYELSADTLRFLDATRREGWEIFRAAQEGTRSIVRTPQS